MNPINPRIFKTLLKGSLGISLFVFILIVLFPILTSNFELKVTDIKFNSRKSLGYEPSMNSSIVLVTLDDLKSDSNMGAWSYSDISKVLQNMANGNPTIIGMDFMFNTRNDTTGFSNLINMMLTNAETINPYLVKYGEVNEKLDNITHRNLLDELRLYDELPGAGVSEDIHHVSDIPYVSGGNQTSFSDASSGFGIVNITPDADAILRRIPIVSEVDGMLAPHFSLRLLAAHTDWELKNMELKNNHKLILHDFPIKGIKKDIRIPLDNEGNMLVNYISSDKIKDQMKTKEFQILSALKILESSTSPDLSGRVVLFGDHSIVTNDRSHTPMDGPLYNPLIFTIIMSNILNESFIYPTSEISSIIILLILVGILLMLARFTKVPWFGVGSCIIISSYLLINFALFVYSGLQIPVFNILIPVIFSSGFILIYLMYDSQVKMGQLEGSLQSYLPPVVVKEIKNNPDSDLLKIGGERKRISVIFSDIVQFTKFTDEADPAEVQLVLDEYFSIMVGLIFTNEGIVDKYMGDGILAFFENSPDSVTSAQLATKTAIQMQEQAIILNNKYKEQHRFPFEIRVAISTGYAKVGNIGPKEKIDYTIIGSVVNLGQRLDALGKPGDIVMDKDTYVFIKDDYDIEDFGEHPLKGFEKPIQVYKLKK